MLRYTLQILLIVILNVFSISLAQVNNNHALLPNLDECGQLKLEEFEDRTGTVQANEFPWMALIAYIDPRTSTTSYRCSAVLINQRYLLTVAHCLENSGRLQAHAVLFGGSGNISEEAKTTQQLAIEEIVVHPYYNMLEKANDIALLRLNVTISYTNSIRPICLPGANIKDKQFGADQLIVAGWYRRASDSWNIQKMPVVISSEQDCRRKYLSFVNITDSHMCGITCFQRSQYISGSALMDTIGQTNYYLAGLLAAGRSVCTYPEEPDIFTRVDRYMDWIKDNIVK